MVKEVFCLRFIENIDFKISTLKNLFSQTVKPIVFKLNVFEFDINLNTIIANKKGAKAPSRIEISQII